MKPTIVLTISVDLAAQAATSYLDTKIRQEGYGTSVRRRDPDEDGADVLPFALTDDSDADTSHYETFQLAVAAMARFAAEDLDDAIRSIEEPD